MVQMMFSKLANRIREIAAVADVRAKPKPDPMAEVDAVLAQEPPRPVLPANIKAANEVINALPPMTHPDRFPVCLKVVLKHEGGYVNHPKDPGGRTNLGVTQRVWEAWMGRKATEQEMRSLTVDKVAPLYRKKYWDTVKGHDLAPGLDLHVFDFAVNAGPARAIRYLQMMIGSHPDGKIGPATMKTLSNYIDQYGTAKAIQRYGELREQYYRQLKTFPTFGRGWLRRNREVTEEALKA